MYTWIYQGSQQAKVALRVGEMADGGQVAALSDAGESRKGGWCCTSDPPFSHTFVIHRKDKITSLARYLVHLLVITVTGNQTSSSQTIVADPSIKASIE